MARGLSKRPLRLKVDADHNFPLSVHKVLSNDDLLMEILLRLPIPSLHIFKRVCKQWQSLITAPSFTLTRTRIPTVDPPSGLFIRRWSQNFNKYDHGFVSFDARIPAKGSIQSLVCLSGVEQSCNGLLLFYKGGNRYVCNPSISMFKMLPPIHDLYYVRNGYEEINLAFDPTKSPCYKVVHVGSIEDDDDNDDRIDYSVTIETYSSETETGVWSVSDDRFPNLWFHGFGHGIYWNGAIHWLNFHHPFRVIKLDIVVHPCLTKIQIPLPVTLNAKGHVHYNRKLLKFHDSLLLLCKDDDSQHLNIYEMKNGYSVWSVKYYVNLDDMMRPYPTWKMPTNWLCRYHMLSVVLGERAEDSFMVIELSGKILQYKFVLETVSELFDFGKAVSGSRCFEHIASFARV